MIDHFLGGVHVPGWPGVHVPGWPGVHVPGWPGAHGFFGGMRFLTPDDEIIRER